MSDPAAGSPSLPEPIRSEPAPARHGRLPRRSGGRSVLAFVGAALAVVLVSSLAVAGIAAWQLSANLGAGVDLGAGPDDTPPPVGPIEGPVNILLVGSDVREGQTGNYGESEGTNLNDVNILLHISPDSRSAVAVSFPRDLYLPIPACPREDGEGGYSAMSRQKLNVTVNYGGLPCPVLTIEQLTGLDIPYAALIQFDGVVAMSTAVGGVEVCVASPIRDDHVGLRLDAGVHTLEGAEALKFLRARYGIADRSDLARISNQQVFLSALVRKVKSSQVLSDPIALYRLAQAATENMTLSTSLSRLDTMASIALALADIPLENIVFVQYPIGITPDGSGLVPRSGDADLLIEAIAEDRPVEVQGLGGGAVAPEETPAPEPSATADAGAPAPEPVPLPSTITGQSAQEQSCSAGGG